MSTGFDSFRLFYTALGIIGVGLQIFGLGLVIWMLCTVRHPSLFLMGGSYLLNVLSGVSGQLFRFFYRSGSGIDAQGYYLVIGALNSLSGVLFLTGLFLLFRWIFKLLEYRDLVEWSRTQMPPTPPNTQSSYYPPPPNYQG